MNTLLDVIKRNQNFDYERFSEDMSSLSKGECEVLLGNIQSEIIKGGNEEVLHNCRSMVLDRINDIEKGVYADTPQNRKLGRVGQQYGGIGSRGGKGKTYEGSKGLSKRSVERRGSAETKLREWKKKQGIDERYTPETDTNTKRREQYYIKVVGLSKDEAAARSAKVAKKQASSRNARLERIRRLTR